MTNTELVKQLRTASVQCDEMRLRDFGYLFKTAADAIEQLETLKEFWEESANNARKLLEDNLPKWIPVTERLPEHTATYLVSVGVNYGGEGEHPEVMTALFQAGGKGFYIDYDRSISGPLVGKPTHWMPLPKPPKEVSE